MTLALSPTAAPALRGLGLPAVLALAMAGALAALVMFDGRFLGDGDTYWHIGAGEWMLRQGRVPNVDPFSHSMPGAPWTAHEWLSEVLMALALRLAGWGGLVALFALAIGAAAAMLVARLSRHVGGLTLVAVTVIAVALLAESLLARPHMLVLPVLLGWALVLLAARDRSRAPHLAWGLLMALWANLHGSYVLGFVLAAAFALEALIEAEPARRWRVVRDWGVFGVLSLAAAMLTPHGPQGLIHPFSIMTLEATAEIKEWRPADLTALTPLTVALFATLFVCLRQGVRLPPVRIALLLLLLFMTFQHARHMLVLGVIAPLLLAPALSAATPAGPLALDRRFAALCGALFIALVGIRLAVPLQRANDAATPAAALAAVPAELAARPVLNGYSYGGYLIFRGVRPYIDGRADLYGDPFFFDYMRATSGNEVRLDRLLSKHRIAWTLFPADHPMVGTLDTRPGWRRLHADAEAVVHVRTP